MAIAAVKATKLTSTTGNNCTGAVAATAGNAIIVTASGYMNTTASGALSSVARTGDTYTVDIDGNTSASVDIQRAGIASAPNVAGGSVTMTVTVTSAQGVVAFAQEFSGLPTSAIRDATSPAIKIGSSAAGSTNTLSNVTADAVFVAHIGTEASGAAVTITSTGTGWSDTIAGTQMKEANANSFPACGAAYKIVSTATTESNAWTLAGPPNSDWGGVIAVYKGSGGGAFDPTQMPFLQPQHMTFGQKIGQY